MVFCSVKKWLLLLVACVLPLGLLMADTDILDASVGEGYGLTHDVGRISTFTTKSLASVINDGDNLIAKFEVDNNTKDGYRVDISSATGGVLRPVYTGDGEEDIPYSLSIVKLDGEIGAGMGLEATLEFHAAGQNEIVIQMSGGMIQSSPTDASFKMTVTVDDGDAMSLSGSYSDTLTLTYTDL